MTNSTENKYLVRLHLVILAVDKKVGKRYILSLNESEIVFPNVLLDNSNVLDLHSSLINYAQNFVFANQIELIPQLINLHCTNMDILPNELNTIYGFVIDKTEQINNSYWIEFSYTDPQKNSLAIFETIQALK